MGQNFTKVDPITIVFFKTHTHEGNLAVQCLRHPVKNELITNNFWYYVFFSGTQSKGNNFGIKKAHTQNTLTQVVAAKISSFLPLYTCIHY